MSLLPDMPWSWFVDIHKVHQESAEAMCMEYIQEPPDAVSTGDVVWNTTDGKWLRDCASDHVRFNFERQEDWLWFKLAWC